MFKKKSDPQCHVTKTSLTFRRCWSPSDTQRCNRNIRPWTSSTTEREKEKQTNTAPSLNQLLSDLQVVLCWLVDCTQRTMAWNWFQYFDEWHLLHLIAAATSRQWTCGIADLSLKILLEMYTLCLLLCCYALACVPNSMAVTVLAFRAEYFICDVLIGWRYLGDWQLLHNPFSAVAMQCASAERGPVELGQERTGGNT